MKNLIERIGHLPTTALGLLFIAVAVAHFTGFFTIGELSEFLHGVDAVLLLLGVGGIAAKGWPQLRSEAGEPTDDEPIDPPTTPLPNPSTPRPPKK